jgi:hypothetical protein
MKRTKTTIQVRTIIIAAFKNSVPVSTIALIVSRPQRTVQNILHCYFTFGVIANRPCTGTKKPKLNLQQRRHLILAAKQDRFASARELLTGTGLSGVIGPNYANHVLRSGNKALPGKRVGGMRCKRARKKPYLNNKCRLPRLHCAKLRQNWTVEWWRTYIFTDESSFELGLNTLID